MSNPLLNGFGEKSKTAKNITRNAELSFTALFSLAFLLSAEEHVSGFQRIVLSY
ncbi:hypothetical protein ABMB67_001917 [Halalkalibacter oceani]